MAEIASAFVSILPSAKGFGSKLESEVGGEVDGAGKGIGSKFGTALKVGALGVLGGALAGAKFLGGAISEAQEAEKITARTENVIKKMGNAAGVSAGQVADLAGSISSKTGIDDEAIQSGQNLLLTFGNVRNEVGKGNDIFNQASSLMVDMSAAMGTDAKGSAIQLGKALNDPIKGLSSLSRVGVSFTAQQKEQITALTESGNVMGAQKIILGELEKQFGGAGEAMATPADKAKVAFGNLQEQIGAALLPAVNGLINLFLRAMPSISAGISAIGPAFSSVSAFLAPLVGKVQDFFAQFGEGSGGSSRLVQFQTTVTTVLGAVRSIFTSFVSIVSSLWTIFGATLTDYAVKAFENIQTIIGGAFTVIQGIFQTFSALLRGDWDGVWEGIKKILSGAWQVIQGIVSQALNVLTTAFEIGWTVLKNIVDAAWEGIKTLVTNAIGKVVDFVTAIPGKFTSALSSLKSTAEGLFRDAMEAGRTKVENITDSIVTWVGGIPGKFTNGLSTLLSTVRTLFDDAMTAGKDKVTTIGSTIVGWIEGVPGKLLDKLGDFKAAGASLIGGFVDGMKNAAGVIEGIASNVWDTVKGLMNGAIAKINAALSFTISLPGKDIVIDPPDIPALASGGVLTRPTLFLGGEGGESEAVLPLSKLTAMLDREREVGLSGAGTRGGGSGATYQFYTFDIENAVREAQRREAFAGAY